MNRFLKSLILGLLVIALLTPPAHAWRWRVSRIPDPADFSDRKFIMTDTDETDSDPGRQMYLQRTHTGALGSGKGLTGVEVRSTFNGTADALSSEVKGGEFKARHTTGNTYDVGTFKGVIGNVDAKNGTVTNAWAVEGAIDVAAGGTITTAAAVRAYMNNSGTVSTSYGVLIASESAGRFTYDIGFQNGATMTESTDGTVDMTGAKFGVTRSLSSQTTENRGLYASLTTDSSYLTGTNLTYSGAYGSSALRLDGTYSGTTGGYSNIASFITSSGTQATDGAGVVGIKQVVTNTAGMTDGEMYGGIFIAKHNHASNVMTASASLIGIEGWAYQSNVGAARTAIGGNFGYHIESNAGTFGAGSVWRGVQIFCDNAAASNEPTEETALCLWNMTGTQDNAIRLVQSGSGFTYLFDLASASAPYTTDAPADTTADGYLSCDVNGTHMKIALYNE